MIEASTLRSLEPKFLEAYLTDNLMGDEVQPWLESLVHNNVLAVLSPELYAMVGFGGVREGHKDLWGHVKQVVAQSPKRPELRWSALFHDVGKVPTFSRVGGKVMFHGHEDVSQKMWTAFYRRWKLFTKPFRAHTCELIRNLGLVESYECDWTDSAVRRLGVKLGPYMADSLDLSRCDLTTKNTALRARILRKIDELDDRWVKIQAADAVVPPLPSNIGNAVMERYGLTPGPLIGKIKQVLLEHIEQNRLESHRDQDYYLTYLSIHCVPFTNLDLTSQE